MDKKANHTSGGVSLSKCGCCPRSCGVDRLGGERGYCGAGALAEVFGYGPHHGEEPPVSGTMGSGAIFFSRCTMRCIYCQNYPWSQEGRGEKYTAEELAGIFRSLRDAGCHNWNLVSPTPWIPQVREALERAGGKKIRVVYNTSGYEKPETVRECADIADVFLFDLRYASNGTALTASDTPDYVDFARKALVEAWEIKGPLETDAGGTAVSGVICRILVLPGHAGEAVENIEWLYETLGKKISLSIMSQYLPCHKASDSEVWGKPVSREEYEEVVDAVRRRGFSEGWIQEYGETAPRDLVGYRMEPGGRRRK